MKELALAAALLGLAACGKPAAEGPPGIHYDRDACARCGMIISEARFASGYVDAQGETVAFDDLGELLAAVAGDPALAAAAYVHDAQDGRWLRASDAVFVKLLPALTTPMGSGYAAFGSEKEAAAFARLLGARIDGPPVSAGPSRP